MPKTTASRMDGNENACIATEAGDYYGFTGWILFGETDGYVEDADFTLEDVHISGDNCYSLYGRDELIIFKKGRFIGGRLGFCCWWSGTFVNGVCKYTVWYNGVFENGVFNGVWFGGEWRNGERQVMHVVPEHLISSPSVHSVDWLLDIAKDIY